MAGETVITVIGNLTSDPELKFTPAGAAVANFTIASTPRTYDRQTNEWRDGETLFLRCSAWRQTAENITESLTRGTRVIAQGRLTQRSYEDRDGNKRTAFQLDIDEIGPSLRNATTQVAKTTGQQQSGQQRPQNTQQQGGWNQQHQQPANDPWATQQQGYSAEPPF